MLSFATEFPVEADRTTVDFLQAMVTWISGSPHTGLSAEMLRDLLQKDEAHVENGKEKVQSLLATSPDVDLAGIRYSRHDNDLEWLTTVVFSRTSSDAWVGVRVECESQHAAARLPSAKKPVVVRTVLESLGGAADGPLPIRDTAHILTNTDIDLAAKLIRGDAGCRLPIVYVSARFQGGYILDVNRLAADLSGMAHVVVEPNRPFSVRLQLEVDSENVYGGTIGICWPEGGGRRAFFLGGDYSTPGHLAGAIKDEVRAALLNRRPIARCTWAYVRETASRQAILSLKASGSKAIDEYVEKFDQEIEAKNQRLEEAESEIQRLRNELRVYEARAGTASGGLLRLGRERDLYPNEVLGILLDAIEDAATRVQHDSRRQHVLRSILEANRLEENPLEGRREQLKRLLRGTSTIDGKLRRELEDMGFSISEDGKHFKLVFQGDDRYTFTLPKSGSDWRGGLNAASDIGRLLF
ncbi:hypothetical protein DZA07_31215 [Pseudomonas aeruginosa]|jgi:hypothetical protein|uniref:Uncharacterized protein n=1 Tax=Ralstonia mannitolilytica TaxID=105219 RepID=A0AAJ5D464_9RALS|nr:MULTISPECIES: hypothetical protein [Pseudomonadota]RTW74487.1 hypothetical protein DZA07_31215 [Pseudomonas aeruginosa]CAG2153741.1 hypothetical protein LMG6866_04499 [Ralstonia mannitolilytica]SUD89614.1 Uncharacterised protein [Ralstonia mannitolilytica]SUD95994.1 Uncharacterised protein [Ralstonia mannitolilytica]